MNTLNNSALDLTFCAAAIAQFAVAILNLFLIRIMKWKPDLDRAPLLIREFFTSTSFSFHAVDLRVAHLAIRS